MTEHPTDLASFRAALLEGDRRLVRRRRRQRAGGGSAVSLIAALVLSTLPFGGGALDASALAAEARRALERPGLVLHSETEVVRPGRASVSSGSAAGRSASAAGRSRQTGSTWSSRPPTAR